MSSWPTRPPRDDNERNYDLVRTKPKTVTACTIISSNVTGALTHYFRGRSRLHKDDACPACLDGHAPRWYGYLGAIIEPSKKVSIIEFTPSVEETINAYFLLHGTLRGARLLLRRKDERANSILQAAIDEGKYAGATLPPEFDIRAVLEKMWEVNGNWGTVEEETRVDLSIVPEKIRERILDESYKNKHQSNGNH